jgi:opacity protein-like surface antigen
MKKILLCAAFCGLSPFILAQNGVPSLAGAYGAGAGNAAVTYTNIYSAVGNQAGLAAVEQFGAAVFAERRFGLAELQSVDAIAAMPTKSGVFALSVHSFGESQKYVEQKIGLAYARKLAPSLSIGGQIDYLSTRIPEYGSRGVVTFELGLLARLLPKFNVGAHIYSPIRQKLTETETLPTVLAVGASYQPNTKVLLTAAVEQDFRYAPTVKAGLDYRLADALSVRLGIGTGVVRVSGGIGLHLKNISIDIAAQYHQILGVSPSVGVSYGVK